jgi:hypothetical protein
MTMSRLGRWVLPVLLALVFANDEPVLLASGTPSHIRVVDPQVASLVATGIVGSATFRSLVARLETAPLLVFVRCRAPRQQAASAGGLEFMANTETYRYVRVFIRCDLPRVVQAPLLAHELQHALEVADAPEIVDPATLRMHYERVGYRSAPDDRLPSFETSAAIDVQRRVAAELGHGRAHTVARIEIEPHTWQ